MEKSKEEIIAKLKGQIKLKKHIIGVATGSGLTAKCAEEGGCDFILAVTTGYFRQKGVSSLAAYLPLSNSNQVVMEMGTKEILTRITIPVLFGLAAADPTIDLGNYIRLIKKEGFHGIVNDPTVGLIDGKFREALESEGISYDKEVEAVRIASSLGLFTLAYVFDENQAVQMIDAGVDAICIHLGLTLGGKLGPKKKILNLQAAVKLVNKIIKKANEVNPEVIKMIFGGPVNKPVDLQFIYDKTEIDGYIGGSSFERIPTEQMITEVTQSFKRGEDIKYNELIKKIIDGISTKEDYIEFIKKYISLNYSEKISLDDLAELMNISRSYLSTLFKKEMGISFTDYLIDYRIKRFIDILTEKKSLPLNIISDMVGYSDYTQFSKIFKKKMGVSPKVFRDNMMT